MSILERGFNLSQRMTQELGRQIVCGAFNKQPGLPTEADLCESFGVSRSAVREAVKMLSAKGLISSKPRQGIRLRPEEEWNIFDTDVLHWSLESNPPLKVLKEFLQARIAIEPEAASLAARFASPEKLDAIEMALERIKLADKNNDINAVLEAEITFHINILYASNNRFYIRLRDFVRTALLINDRHAIPRKLNSNKLLEDHTTVFQAIKNRDPEAAKHIMVGLIDKALHIVEEELLNCTPCEKWSSGGTL